MLLDVTGLSLTLNGRANLHDLVNQVQPLSLILNGVTAFFALVGFARSGLVAWRPAIMLAVLTTVMAPLGAWLHRSWMHASSESFASPQLPSLLMRPS